MDIEYLKDNCKEKEYIAFVDSADQRLQRVPREFEYILKNKYGQVIYDQNQDIVKGIDTMANRENFVYDYVVTFQQPFENVVSVEVLEAYIPTAPLREIQRETKQDDILRYITVSCPEIEQHIKRNKKETDYSFRLCRIGWESLQEKNYLFYRLPFSRRYFHPIGKLAKINLKFLKNNTDVPIDFLGAHHTLLISIHCLEPDVTTKPEFTLNPQYNPNKFPDHFSSMHADSDDEDS